MGHIHNIQVATPELFIFQVAPTGLGPSLNDCYRRQDSDSQMDLAVRTRSDPKRSEPCGNILLAIMSYLIFEMI